jgi:hypothetical protein
MWLDIFRGEGESLGFFSLSCQQEFLDVRQEVTGRVGIYLAYCSVGDSMWKPTETRKSLEELKITQRLLSFGITRCCVAIQCHVPPSDVFPNSHRPGNSKSMVTMRGDNDSVQVGWPHSNLGRREKFFCSPKGPDRLSGPHSLLFNGYRCSFAGLKWPGREFNHFHLVPRLRMSGALRLFPLYFFMTPTEAPLVLLEGHHSV